MLVRTLASRIRYREQGLVYPNFEVWVLKRGGHCAFMAVDNNWYEKVLREFFGTWAERP